MFPHLLQMLCPMVHTHYDRHIVTESTSNKVIMSLHLELEFVYPSSSSWKKVSIVRARFKIRSRTNIGTSIGRSNALFMSFHAFLTSFRNLTQASCFEAPYSFIQHSMTEATCPLCWSVYIKQKFNIFNIIFYLLITFYVLHLILELMKFEENMQDMIMT